MNFSQIALVTIFLFCLVSCQNVTGKVSSEEEKKNQAPSIESRKTEKSLPKLNQQRPTVKPQEKEVEKKKKKIKAIDTLKPVVAIP